ncbi:ImmA/IrrE family metallo-endopeptidase [Peptacetobacter hiranonis]|uniref:Putative toxin-antitoxin system, toxin component n=1 Tax=Peptacetobacter hiranonis (strain DSM 13275 / JCM 10541 / KCTC 15199 / TO-931) TaxID=500633 RepID=B6FZV6_PEPHT|nr:ImmA/IrrE family metallo-endopeptidase [Peptacetobacter hiranonis]EEA84929.1 putative toxin-antitoxin system, toxin component [Peptacetobacter hiranonis DSM 13275]QEK20810.1 Metallopeptidase ImmA [Peptacetobacter hiranonis]
MDVKEYVSIIKKKANTDDVFELVDYFNINVIETDLGSSTLGMYRYIKRNKFIFLNNDLEHYQKKFVLAHELGHAILHSDLNCFFLEKKTLYLKNKFEIEANKFAVELLVSDDDLKELEGYTIEQMSAILNIPSDLLKYKFK